MDAELGHAFSDYLTLELNQSQRTASTYLGSIRRLEKFCGKPVELIEPTDGRRFLREASLATSTKSGTIAAWHSIHKFGAMEGRWNLNGVLAVRGPKTRQVEQDCLAFDLVVPVLGECRLPVEFRLTYLPLYAGLRRREATFVRREDWRDGWIRVREGKGGKERRVPVHPELEVVRRIILASFPTHESTLQKACKRLRERTGIMFRIHWLRTTFSRRLESMEVPNEVRGAIMGHAPNMQTHYSGISERRMIEAVMPVRY